MKLKSDFLMLNLYRKLTPALFVCALLFMFAAPIFAQEEGEPVVIDQVIAQVNNDVITLSQLKRAMRDFSDALAQQNMERDARALVQKGATEDQALQEIQSKQTEYIQKAMADIEAKRAEIIANLVNEQLVMQQGKELGLENEVEAEVNKRLIEIANSRNLKTITELEQAMTASGVSPSQFRADARRSYMMNFVIGSEVDRKTFLSLPLEEVKAYFNANQARFAKPETLVLSEIFLSSAQKDAATIQARANDLVKQARGGADFGTLATNNSDYPNAAATKGKIGAVEFANLRPEVRTALGKLPAGSIPDPIKTPDGFLIVRIDERTLASAPVFEENKVREVMAVERSPKERNLYLKKLRDEAFVKIADDYRPSVEAEFNKSIAATSPATNTTPKARQ